MIVVNTAPAKYTVQIGPTTTPEMAGELFAWAERLGKSASEVARECLEEGLMRKRREFQRIAGGELDATLLDRHVRQARKRGERQVATRLAADKRRREAAARA